MIDWARHYDTIYQTLGVSALLTANNTDAVEAAITVIDKTTDAKTGQWLELQTVRPVAAARVAELVSSGAGLDDLDGGGIVFNGKTYTIETHQVKPAPTGESLGEVYLIMTETAYGGGGEEELDEAPEGFAYIVNADGESLVNADGAYILAKVE